MVSTFKAKCGIATHTLDLSNALVDQRKSVFVVAERSSGIDESQETSIPYERVFDRRHPSSFDRIVPIAREHGSELLHVQHESQIFPGNTFQQVTRDAKAEGLRVVATFHSLPYPENYQRIKSFSANVDLAISYTSEGKRALDLAGFKRTVFLPHGVRIFEERSILQARRMLGIEPDRFVFSSSGFVGSEKGLIGSLVVLKKIQEKIPNALFIHAGGLNPAVANSGASYMSRLRIVMRKLEISPHDFILTGYLSDALMPVYGQASNVIVLNYLPSGVLSASGTYARAGVSLYRPIVTVNGTRRIEEAVHRATCLKVPYNSPIKMAEAIIQLHDHPELGVELVERQRTYVAENNWEAIAKEHVALYEQALQPQDQLDLVKVGTE